MFHIFDYNFINSAPDFFVLVIFMISLNLINWIDTNIYNSWLILTYCFVEKHIFFIVSM